MNPNEKLLLDRVALWRGEAEARRGEAREKDLSGCPKLAGLLRAQSFQLESCASQLERLARVAR